MKNVMFFALCAVVLVSCKNDDEKIFSENKDENLSFYSEKLSINLQKKENMLVFDSKEEFDNAVNKIQTGSLTKVAERSSNVDITGSIENVYNDQFLENDDIVIGKNVFYSLYDHFVNAMNEAEKYYDVEGGYEKFKNKYSTLYFPEYKDDYSAYLPVSNKNIAKLLNAKGEVMIGKEIVNFIDVDSYEKLIDLGLAPVEKELFPVTRANGTYPKNYLPEKRCNDRKLWVQVITRPGSGGVLEEIVVQVMFRKKGVFGAWYNYSSETVLSWDPGVAYNKSGYSSHDYKWARLFQNGKSVPFAGLMFVKFRGFGTKCGDEKFYFNVNI